MRLVALSALRVGESPRFGDVDRDLVLALATEAAAVPPIVVHWPTMRVVDGIHRLLAARVRGDQAMRVKFFSGTLDDAFVLSVYYNGVSGFPLTEAERLAAVARIHRTHPHWPLWVIRALAGLPVLSFPA
ncbi:hypothetical protein [Amycolatopsis anabasis]|uniref:hypothetical protein n=1 Tax=Amycolatopsis anabasis TaxID=1840409 RepID=UPI001C551A92|nr:hypothetical protein [Amycolatopsis anabasis]